MKAKVNSSIALFLALAITFATIIGNIFTAHLMLSSYELDSYHRILPQSSNSKLRNSHNCKDMQTLNCPLGKETPFEYHQAMLSSYRNEVNTDLFRKCANLPLPMTPKDPVECWPRLIILPSHATSGNELFQYLMDRVFTNLDISMSQYHEWPSRKDPLFSISNNPLDLWKVANATASNYIFSGVWGTRNTTAAIPFLGRPAIFKSHTSQSDNITRRKEVAKPLIETEQQGFLHGVIRMARNPGDQILRNSFRWLSKKCYSDGDECFFKNAHICCEDIVDDARTYRAFHSFWDEIGLRSPEIIVHYEDITSKDKVSRAIQSVMHFLDGVSPVENYLNSNNVEMVEHVRDVIRELKYEQGTLVAQICGKEVAKMVHDATKEYSVPLGYVFNENTGVWSLKYD